MTAKKRMGRPPLPKKERKATHVSVRVTLAEYRTLERAAKLADVPVSDWVRGIVMAASLEKVGGSA